MGTLDTRLRLPRGPRCSELRANGQRCRCTAVYGGTLCRYHGGEPAPRPKLRPCSCRAYAWPHRAAGGACRYPDPTRLRLTTPAGQHNEPSGWRRAQRALERQAERGDPAAAADLERRY
jgi:hypothetical protein